MNHKEIFDELILIAKVCQSIELEKYQSEQLYRFWQKEAIKEHEIPLIHKHLKSNWNGRNKLTLADLLPPSEGISNEALELQKRNLEYDFKIKLENALKDQKASIEEQFKDNLLANSNTELKNEVQELRAKLIDLEDKHEILVKAHDDKYKTINVLEAINLKLDAENKALQHNLKIANINNDSFEAYLRHFGVTIESEKYSDEALKKIQNERKAIA